MANTTHVSLIKKGSLAWNAWRNDNPKVALDLRGASLVGADLVGADLFNANFRGAFLQLANLSKANLSGADLSGADLSGANLTRAGLSWANLTDAFLCEASLREADLSWAILSRTDLTDADLGCARIAWTTFGGNDLSTVKGLETVTHRGPSTIGVDTLFKSNGKTSEEFLRGAGVPEDFITFVPSLVGRAIEFYSCFISYSHETPSRPQGQWRMSQNSTVSLNLSFGNSENPFELDLATSIFFADSTIQEPHAAELDPTFSN